MSEGPKSPDFLSAEKMFELDRDDIEVKVHAFMQDPIAELARLREDFGVEYEYDVNDSDQNPAALAMEFVDDMIDFIATMNMTCEDEGITTYMNYGSFTEQGDEALFGMLKAAGYERGEVAASLYLLPLESCPDFSERRRAQNSLKASIARLDSVYAEDE